MRLIPQDRAQRTLAAANLLNTVGNGVFFTAGVLYFTRAVHFGTSQVGIGLSAAGLVALFFGIPIGHLADRRGPRGVYVATLLGGALAMALFSIATSFWIFVVAACIGAIAQTAGPAARAPMIRKYGGDRPQEFRAYLRSVTNIGIALGSVAAGWAIQVDTYDSYLFLIIGNGISFVASALVVLRLPPTVPEPAQGGTRWMALRDRPYVLLSVLDGILAIQYKILTVAVPLWVIEFTSAPRWVIAAGVVVNTVMVSSLQVRVSRGVDTPRAGGHALRRSSLAFVVASVLIPLASGPRPAIAATLVLTGVAVLTVGELWQAAGGFEVSFQLAPAHATGQYLGLFGMGLGLSDAVAPVLLTSLCIGLGQPGWYMIAALFAVTGVCVPLVVRWAERSGGRVTSGHGAAGEPCTTRA